MSLAKVRDRQRLPGTKQKSLHNTLGKTVGKYQASHVGKGYSSNDIICSVGRFLAYKLQMPTFLQPIPYLALPKIVVKFVLREVHNSFYANHRKFTKKKASNLPDWDLDFDSNVSELLTTVLLRTPVTQMIISIKT